MTPRQRFLNALVGKPVDRVPLELPGFQCDGPGAPQEIADPLRAGVAARVLAETHYDVSVPSHINRMLVTPPQRIRLERTGLPGGQLRTCGIIDTPKGELTFAQVFDPAAQTTWQEKYPVESMADIEKIASVPWEIPEGLAPPQGHGLPPSFPERGVLMTRISSPFVCVAAMMKYERFLELCAENLDLVMELTEVCRQRVLDCTRVLLSTPGIDYVWMGGSEWVTAPMGSPALYDALVQEQEKSLIDFIHDTAGVPVHIHCHGNISHALPRTIERGGDYTEPVEPPPDGGITMAGAKQLAAGRITLGGNIECRILCNEGEDAVDAAVHAAFEGGKDRFVLRPTEGPSPMLSEREHRNYMRMIDLWEALSPV